ncbi:TraB/GumN family protein [Rubrivirga sp.]|uniref:TraB/GumN family protein n=1 Tax=Rubrivirga sp. TaxID=1885344 RepID=UPI003B529D6F
MRRLVALSLALGLAASVAAQVDARRPPLYVVEHDGAKVYLLGSVHVLPEGALPLPRHVEALYAAASVVAFEIDLAEATTRVGDLMGAATDEALLRDVLDDAQRDSLAVSLRSFGVPETAFDGFEPWFAGMSYGMLTLQHDDRVYGEGVDAYLFSRAEIDGKELVALETLDDQIAAFDDLSDASQVAYLMGLVGSADQAGTTFAALLDAWASGDEDRLSAVLSDELSHPEVFESLLVRRNRAWIPGLLDLLDRPGEVSLVVVGAGHLVGRGNVVALLREAGFKARRITG